MPYLTPETVPSATTCRALLIPDSTEWLALFSGALTELSFRYNWERQGITIEETLTVVNQVIEGFYDGCVSSGCTQPDGVGIFRVNDAGHIEQLVDGEWVPPQGPYAIPSVPARTEPTTQERKCLAAANAVNVMFLWYENLTESFNNDISAAEAFTTLVAFIALTFFWLAPIVNGLVLILAGIAELIYQGLRYASADVWDNNFTDIMTCMLYECATDTGDVITFDLECFMNKIQEKTLTPPWTETMARLAVQISYLLQVVGGVDALNAAGATDEIGTHDCSECEQSWCMTINLEETSGEFEFVNGAGEWVSGTGLVAEDGTFFGNQRTIVQGTFPFDETLHLTYVGMVFDWHPGSVNGGVVGVGAWTNAITNQIIGVPMTLVPDADGQGRSVEGDWDTDDVSFDLQTSQDSYGGSATLKTVILNGTGDPPLYLEGKGWTFC